MNSVRTLMACAALAALLGGCSGQGKKNGNSNRVYFDPANQYPEWAYDAPFYYRPAGERGKIGETVEPKVPGGPYHHYASERTIYLPRPNNIREPNLPARTTAKDFAPRIAVYWTQDGGHTWERHGYFGVGQSFYALLTENDGIYGFRLVGPGLPPAKCIPPRPQVVYHVDTTPPNVAVFVEPNQPLYGVGDEITVHWLAMDENLVDRPVSLASCWEEDVPGQEDCCDAICCEQPAEGSMTFVIPPRAVGYGIRIKGEAQDRAKNVGVGLSALLPVVAEVPSTQPTPATNTGEPTSRPSTVAMQAMSIIGEAELASFEDAGSVPPERTPPVDRKALWSKKSKPTATSLLPPINAEPFPADAHWSAQPWQTLSPQPDRRTRQIWMLPSKPLPLAPTHMDSDTP